MRKIRLFSILIIISIAFFSCYDKHDSKIGFPELYGPYLGQIPPDSVPQLFAPEIVSTSMYTRDMAIMPDGNEIYFCISALGYNLIFCTKQIDGKWTEPAPVSFIDDFQYMYYEPCISHDGKQLFFLSNKPKSNEETKGNEDIWVVDRIDDNWSDARNLGEPICTENAEFFPSVTKEGTLYFTRNDACDGKNYIFRSRLNDGVYQEPEKLGTNVNCGTNRFNAYISPDESFIIVPALGMDDTYGGVDYYIVFRDEDDNWSEPINMGSNINNPVGSEWSPYISPDGKYFFFMASKTNPEVINGADITYRLLLDNFNKPQNGNASIYWVEANFIQDLNPLN